MHWYTRTGAHNSDVAVRSYSIQLPRKQTHLTLTYSHRQICLHPISWHHLTVKDEHFYPCFLLCMLHTRAQHEANARLCSCTRTQTFIIASKLLCKTHSRSWPTQKAQVRDSEIVSVWWGGLKMCMTARELRDAFIQVGEMLLSLTLSVCRVHECMGSRTCAYIHS